MKEVFIVTLIKRANTSSKIIRILVDLKREERVGSER